jgi:hypothetical protein
MSSLQAKRKVSIGIFQLVSQSGTYRNLTSLIFCKSRRISKYPSTHEKPQKSHLKGEQSEVIQNGDVSLAPRSSAQPPCQMDREERFERVSPPKPIAVVDSRHFLNKTLIVSLRFFRLRPVSRQETDMLGFLRLEVI